MLRSPQTHRSWQVSAPWWQCPEALCAGITDFDQSPATTSCYRIADGDLVFTTNCANIATGMRDVWGDCAIADPSFPPSTKLVCSLFALRGSAVLRLSVQEPAQLSAATIASDLLKYLYQGNAEKYVEVTSTQAEWRAFAAVSDPCRPVILANGGQMLVDLQAEASRFLPYFLIGAVLRLQRNVIAVHAGSVVIKGNGVLIAGPSRSGKTTQSLALAARGHRFLGDNIAALRPASGELLPVCRTGFIRTGPRAQTIDALLRANGTAFGDSVGNAQIPFRVAQFFPQRPARPTPLRYAFFLRDMAGSAAVHAFSPDLADFETVLRPLTFDCAVATSWGSTAGEWWMRHLRLQRALSKVRCYYLDSGEPDATAELIEQTVMEELWRSP